MHANRDEGYLRLVIGAWDFVGHWDLVIGLCAQTFLAAA
jgi:hypothetical protein